MASIAGIASPVDELNRQHLETARARLVQHYRDPEQTSDGEIGMAVCSLRERGRRDFLAHHRTDRFSGWWFGYAEHAPSALLKSLFDAAAGGHLPEVIRSLNGSFFAVLHDRLHDETILVTDALGLRPLYVSTHRSALRWSSEAKGAAPPVLGLDALDKSSIAMFLGTGHLIGDQTYFRGVTLAPAASIGRWRADLEAPVWTRYWTWGEVAQLAPTTTIEDAVAELSARWPRAIERCAKAVDTRRSYLWLSGGFDSRLIAAALARQGRPTNAITYGQEGSSEIAIARRVGDILGITVEPLYFDSTTWFDNRERMLFKTDCAMQFLHLHSGSHLERMNGFGDVVYDGFFGDVVLGDSQHKDDRFRNTRANPEVAERFYPGQPHDAHDAYFDVPHIEPYLLHHRGRRFTRSGGLAVSDDSENLLPFMDHELLRFLMSLPDELRKDKRLYAAFATAMYPEVFATVPHAKTLGGRVLADYEQLLRTPAMLELMATHLDPARSRLIPLGHDYRKHFELWRDRSLLGGPKASRHRSYREFVCRAVSFELWAARLGV